MHNSQAADSPEEGFPEEEVSAVSEDSEGVSP